MATVDEQKVLLTVEEAAARLNINRSAAYVLIMRGELVSVKIGRARRIPVVEVDRFIQGLIEAQRTLKIEDEGAGKTAPPTAGRPQRR